MSLTRRLRVQWFKLRGHTIMVRDDGSTWLAFRMNDRDRHAKLVEEYRAQGWVEQ